MAMPLHPTEGASASTAETAPARSCGVRRLRVAAATPIPPPKVACEVVSKNNARKDYGAGPRKYAAAGVQELWVFDPQRHGPDDDGGPWTLQVWERGKAGDFRRVYVGDGPAWSAYFEAWLVVSSDGRTLRLSDDEEGTALWPTEAEEAQAAQARVAALEAELAALRRG